MEVCSNCKKEIAPVDFLFPLGRPSGVQYCVCIRWPTLYLCGTLSASNARRLLDDADLLLRSAGPELYAWFERLKVEPTTGSPTDDEAVAFAKKVGYPRLITALSLLVLAMQEIGKARLSMDYIKEKKNLDYNKDYRAKFADHAAKSNAAKNLMKELNNWPEVLEKRSRNLEVIRQASNYVDYDYNYGLWLDPTSLGAPDEGGSWYSHSVLTGLLDLMLGGDKSEASNELTTASLYTERFNTFAFGWSLNYFLSQTSKVLEDRFANLLKDEEIQKQIAASTRFRDYLRRPADIPEGLWVKEVARRLQKITELVSPGIAQEMKAEVDRFFGS
jgi:AbiV family abortive infection protein